MNRLSRLSVLLLSFVAACAGPMATRTSVPVTVGIVAINDFHGSLEPPKQAVVVPDGKGGTNGVPAGGVAYLASAIDSIRAKYAHSMTVSAGDLISGSPLVSSLYLDEPSVEVMNRIGLDFNAVGNHEFDNGRDELLRKQSGGCVRHTARKPCQVEPFKGANFRFLAANVLTESGKPLFVASGIKSFGSGRDRVTVGVIGLTLRETPTLVAPDGIKGLRFVDEADTINAAIPALKSQGADAIVVLIHQGGKTRAGTDPQGCTDFAGDIEPILARLDPRIDVVVSGHTHWAYVCDWGARDAAHPLLLTSAGVYGELVTDIRLEIDPVAHRVIAKQARNVIVQSAPYESSRGPMTQRDDFPRFEPRADIAAYVARYVDAAKQFAQRPAGRLAGPAARDIGDKLSGGSIGMLIADAQLAATAGAGAQIALTNPFGVRAPGALNPRADGALTFGELYAIQPFNNELVTQSLTGAELKAVLEQNFDEIGPQQVLIPSQGFTYRFDLAKPIGQRIVALALNGVPIDPLASYRVTTGNFLAQGGDTYTGLTKGTDRVIGVSDIAALEAWLQAVPQRAVPLDARVTQVK
ncbi:MAG TPA: bifunctional metallophosphatase/5'-nucleotidase [Novosphingobium sp.]|nr:bifunctional metallophosphatase/5'-nucleotidase [Novosphingobium sp.]